MRSDDRRESATPKPSTEKTMKKILLLTIALLGLAVSTAPAQEWKEALKKAATSAADKLTDGKLTQYALIGTWSYSAPGVKLESDDTLSDLSAAALSGTVGKQLEKAYRIAGIEPGAGTFAFAADGTFAAELGKHALGGTYEYDAATHTVTLHFAKGKFDLGSVPGHACISGTELQLLFPVTRLMEIVRTLGSRISSLAAVTRLLERYDDAYLGFEFDRSAE